MSFAFWDGVAIGVLAHAVYQFVLQQVLRIISPAAREERRMRRETRGWTK